METIGFFKDENKKRSIFSQSSVDFLYAFIQLYAHNPGRSLNLGIINTR